MREMDLSEWIHEHIFDEGSQQAEARTRLVMWITLATMVVEITAGWWYNSMALQADGWHMSSHAVAIGLSAFAYAAASRYAKDPRFAFGTGKVGELAGFASAVSLVIVAILIGAESLHRLLNPKGIKIEKTPLTPIVEVNRTGETTRDPLRWQVDFANVGDVGPVSAGTIGGDLAASHVQGDFHVTLVQADAAVRGVDGAVRAQAEAHAAEDKKFRELVEVRNRADAMLHAVDKSLKDLGEKVSGADRAKAESAISDLRAILKSDDGEAIAVAVENRAGISTVLFNGNPLLPWAPGQSVGQSASGVGAGSPRCGAWAISFRM